MDNRVAASMSSLSVNGHEPNHTGLVPMVPENQDTDLRAGVMEPLPLPAGLDFGSSIQQTSQSVVASSSNSQYDKAVSGSESTDLAALKEALPAPTGAGNSQVDNVVTSFQNMDLAAAKPAAQPRSWIARYAANKPRRTRTPSPNPRFDRLVARMNKVAAEERAGIRKPSTRGRPRGRRLANTVNDAKSGMLRAAFCEDFRRGHVEWVESRQKLWEAGPKQETAAKDQDQNQRMEG